MEHANSRLRIGQPFNWRSVVVGVACYAVLGILLRQLPNPMFPNGVLALNMIVIVVAAYFGGPLPGLLIGLLGTAINFLAKTALFGSPDWYEACAIVPHALMGLSAGLMKQSRGKVKTSLTILVGHSLNLLVFLAVGLIPVRQIFEPLFWNGILAEAAMDIIVIALIIGIAQNPPWVPRPHPTLPNRRQFLLISGGIALLLAVLGALFLSGIELAAYLFVIPVILSAVFLGFLEAWLTALLLSFFLGREVMTLGLVQTPAYVSLILMLNLMALALGELVENLRQQQQLAAERLNELSRAYKALTRADKLKSEMIQNISHEFRTPLSMILGYNDLLVTGVLGELTEAQEKALKVSEKHGWRLAYLVEQITILHQVEEGNLTWQQVSLHELVQEEITKWQERAVQSNCSIDFFYEDVPTLEADAQCLTQVLSALLDNAIKFSPDGGPVTVRLWADDGRALLTVRDRGIGIPLDKQALIFDRFYQVDGSTTRRFGGLGTGLAVVKEVVHAHDGEVWVESDPNQGSLFGLWLPIQPPTKRVRRPQISEAALTQSWEAATAKSPASGY